MVLAQIDGEIVRQFLEQTGQAIGNFFLTGLGGFFFRIIRVAFPLIAILLLVKCTASMMRKRRPLKYAACFLNLASAERIPFVYAENVIGRSKASDIVLGIPTVSLVLGGGHSIGVPMAVSADYSFVVPSATMVIHPVRSNGMFIGVAQTYRNMEKTQDRITTFISGHSHMTQKRLEELMLDTSQLVKDVGTMLEGPEAVKEGLIDEVGGIREALGKLYELIEMQKKE